TVEMSGLTYKVGEVILCKHVPLDEAGYEAKIMESRPNTEGSGNEYLVHYKGWNTRYDVWIDHDEVDNMFFKHTPEDAIAHKKILDEKDKKSSKTPKKTKAVETTPTMSSRKRRHQEREGSTASSQDSQHDRIAANQDSAIVLPDKLRAMLLDDSDIVNRQHKLVKLPAEFTIETIVKDYGKSVSGQDEIPDVAGNDEMLIEYNEGKGHKKDVVLNKHDMIESSFGVIDYFNVLMGSQLLYAGERKQYENACVNPTPGAPGRKVNKTATPELEEMKILPSSVYGAAHLVRLFVKISPLISQGSYGKKSIDSILAQVKDFIMFLSKNVHKYHDIKRDYYVASKEDLTVERD
ncbi:mrg-1, partial [Pristionchus pacificus]